MNTLAERTKSTRLELGMTQEDLAALAKVSQSLIHKIESGETLESRKIAALALALGVNTDWLAKGIGEKYRGEAQKAIKDECKDEIDRIIEIAVEEISALKPGMASDERMHLYTRAIFYQTELQIDDDELRKRLAAMIKK